MLKKVLRWLTPARNVAAWFVLPAFLLMFIAQQKIAGMNPPGVGPWPELLPRPSSWENWLRIRNDSFLIALLTGLFSLPIGKQC
jgi:hypothetical protein